MHFASYFRSLKTYLSECITSQLIIVDFTKNSEVLKSLDLQLRCKLESLQ